MAVMQLCGWQLPLNTSDVVEEEAEEDEEEFIISDSQYSYQTPVFVIAV